MSELSILSVTHLSSTIFKGSLNAWNQESHAYITANAVTSFSLIQMIHVVVLIVPMKTLRMTAGSSFDGERDVDDGMCRVRMLFGAVIVICCLGKKELCEFIYHRTHEPFLANRLTARDHSRTPPSLWGKQRAFPWLI
jgi:hypothetical protein